MIGSDDFYQGTFALSKKLSECMKEPLSKNYLQNQLLNVNDDVLIVWCADDACLYTQTFHTGHQQGHCHTEESRIQTLALSRPPIWEVQKILTNVNGTAVLLIGHKGIAVVELPKRWGNPCLYEGGKCVVSCRVEYIGEQFLVSTSKVSIVSAAWYPGSLDNSHVIVLSSDNYLRIYDVSCSDIPEKVYPVAKGESVTSSKFGGASATGEVAVAFDIGPPSLLEDQQSVNLFHKYKDIFDEAEDLKRRHYNLEWPVFILYSSGEVYYTITSLNKKKYSSLYGPLTMLPNSFDNYGLDFCNLIVLQSSPIVLVIGNSEGSMHHCILMEKTKTELEAQQESVDTLVDCISQLNLQSPIFVLHVYESISLSFSSESNKLLPSPFLLSDPNIPSRYWVSHKEGVYMISVPLVEKLIQFSDPSEDCLFPDGDLESHIEHFVCTQTFSSIDGAAVKGLCIPNLPSKVYVMLSTGIIATLPVPALFSNVSSYKMQTGKPLSSNNPQSNFSVHIGGILKRSTSQPLLISGSSKSADLQEYLNLLKDVQDTLRKNYISPQIKAREEIERRKKILTDQKIHLQMEVSGMLKEKQMLAEKAHSIAERYEETNDKHLQLMERLEKVLNHYLRDLPLLSSSERGMLKELEEIMDNSHTFAVDLGQINAKRQWHLSQKNKQETNEVLHSRKTSSLSENQITCLKVALGKESERLAALVKKVTKMKKDFAV